MKWYPEKYDKRHGENVVEDYIHSKFNPFVKALFKDTKGLKILDIGCGTGEFIKESGGFTVGIDKSIEMLQEAGKKANRKNIFLIRADMENIPLKPGFDKIFFIGSLEYADHKKVLKEADCLLNDNGKIEFVAWNKNNPLEIKTRMFSAIKKKEYLRKYSKKELKKMMKGYVCEKCTSFGMVTHYPQKSRIPVLWKVFEKAWKPMQSSFPLGLILYMSFRKTSTK